MALERLATDKHSRDGPPRGGGEVFHHAVVSDYHWHLTSGLRETPPPVDSRPMEQVRTCGFSYLRQHMRHRLPFAPQRLPPPLAWKKAPCGPLFAGSDSSPGRFSTARP